MSAADEFGFPKLEIHVRLTERRCHTTEQPNRRPPNLRWAQPCSQNRRLALARGSWRALSRRRPLAPLKPTCLGGAAALVNAGVCWRRSRAVGRAAALLKRRTKTNQDSAYYRQAMT